MTASPRPRSLAARVASLRTLASFGPDVVRALAALRRLWGEIWPSAARPSAEDAARVAELIRRAGEAQRADRHDEAAGLYRQALGLDRANVVALRALREMAVERRQWNEALALQERLVAAASAAERVAESEWLAIVHYERGRAELAAGHVPSALVALRQALRAQPRFMPAALALGDAHEAAGEMREAVRVWERTAETDPSLPLLARLERVHRAEGRPSRMIALYRQAMERVPDDLSLAVALGRVYLELEMLDAAADQLEKVEVRAPDLLVVHAFLGAVFERRGDTREALDEYRRALRLSQAFSWPHRCRPCGATTATWEDRCPRCGRWNTLSPVGGQRREQE